MVSWAALLADVLTVCRDGMCSVYLPISAYTLRVCDVRPHFLAYLMCSVL